MVNLLTFIIVILKAPWRAETRFVNHTLVVYRDVWVSVSHLRFFKSHLGGEIVKTNSIVNTRCFRADDLGKSWVLRLLDLTLDCQRSVFIDPLLVPLR